MLHPFYFRPQFTSVYTASPFIIFFGVFSHACLLKVVTFAAHWVLRGGNDVLMPSLRVGRSLEPSRGSKNSSNSSSSSSTTSQGGGGTGGRRRRRAFEKQPAQRAQRALAEASSTTGEVWKVRGPIGGDYGGSSGGGGSSSSNACGSGFASLAVPRISSVLANRSSVNDYYFHLHPSVISFKPSSLNFYPRLPTNSNPCSSPPFFFFFDFCFISPHSR